jgi:hypothetical protein
MAYSVLYTFTPDEVADAVQQMQRFRQSEDAFTSYLVDYWGKGRKIDYP